jgi:phosphatidylglycerophosphate synthase
LLKERFGESIDRVILWIAPAITQIPLSANQITFCGVLTSLLVGIAFATGHPFLAGLLLLPTGFCDLADGIVARAQGTSSRAGAFLDSTMDRVSDLLIYGGLAVDAAVRGDPARATLVVWAIGAAFLTSYSRARAECELDELKVGLMERGERFAVLIPGALFGGMTIALWLLAIAGTLTSLQRIWVAYRRISEQAVAADPDTEVELDSAGVPAGDAPETDTARGAAQSWSAPQWTAPEPGARERRGTNGSLPGDGLGSGHRPEVD